jgi:hypothetical protein
MSGNGKSTRDDRLVDNQRSFRSASDRLEDLVIVEEQRLVPFLCECADRGCTGRIDATIQEFETAHENPVGSFVLPGHARGAGDEVLSQEQRFDIVSRA